MRSGITRFLLTLTLAAAIGNAAVTVGSSTWAWQNPLPLGNGLNAISCPGATNCFAVGDLGTILVTTNGPTWTSLASPTTTTLRGVSCPNPTTCYAVGDGGLILKTNDGTTWFQQPSGTRANLRGVSCFANFGCMVAAAGGTVLLTVNDGASWFTSVPTTEFEPNANDLVAVSCLNNGTVTCVVAGSYADPQVSSRPIQMVWQTTDLGATWTPLFGSNGPSPNVMPFAGVGNLTAVGVGPQIPDTFAQGGAVISPVVVTDRGYAFFFVLDSLEQNWFEIGQLTQTSLYGLGCNSSLCYAVGNSNNVFNLEPGSSGSGVGFLRVFDIPFATAPPALFGVSCPSTQCYAVGSNGLIATNPMGGFWFSQWTTVTGNPLISTSCPAEGICFAVGWDGTIVSTTNGGSTWIKASSVAVGTTANLQAVNCPSTTTCIAVGAGGVIVGTNNSGQTWPAQKSNTSASLNAVACPTTLFCYAGGAGAILFSRDTGSTWLSEVPPPSGTTINGIACTSAFTCIAVGTGPLILNTKLTFLNDSVTWTRQNSPTSNALNAVTCPSSSTCFAVGDGGVILTSTNGGSTWSSQTSPTGHNLTSISCLGSTCYAGSSLGHIISTYNSGASWGIEAQVDPNFEIQPLGGSPPKILEASGIEGLSCADSLLSSRCMAVGSAGTIVSKFVAVQIVGLGTGHLTPLGGSSEVGEPTKFSLSWTVPAPQVWRDLKYLDLRLAGDQGISLWARFIPGNPSALALLDGNGNIVSEGVPGAAGVLDSPAATLDLARSSFEAAGPTSPTVTVDFAVALKPSAAPGPAARVYKTQLLITNVSGETSAPDDVGHWAVRPSH